MSSVPLNRHAGLGKSPIGEMNFTARSARTRTALGDARFRARAPRRIRRQRRNALILRLALAALVIAGMALAGNAYLNQQVRLAAAPAASGER